MSADPKKNEENHKTVKDQKRDKNDEPKPVRFSIQANDQEDKKQQNYAPNSQDSIERSIRHVFRFG